MIPRMITIKGQKKSGRFDPEMAVSLLSLATPLAAALWPVPQSVSSLTKQACPQWSCTPVLLLGCDVYSTTPLMQWWSSTVLGSDHR